MRRVVLVLAICFLASACKPDHGKVLVGAKSFAEQAILAQVVRQLIEAKTDLSAAIVHCGDTYDCAQALRSGRIDLMVEYSGTGLMHHPSRKGTRRASLEDVRNLYMGLGLRWLEPLGFDNSYQFVMPTDRAILLGLTSIADLANLEGGVRIATPGAYLRRPGDGLPALLRHHGLRLRQEPLIINDAAERIRQLIKGRADVAVVYGTDGALQDLTLTTLQDTLQFFPRYDAAIVARESVLESRPELVETLTLLNGRIATEVMQQLNFEMAIEGWTPELVAHRFLRDQELLEGVPRPQPRQPELVIAVDERDPLGELAVRAIRAVRKVFPDRPVHLESTQDAVEAVVHRRARLAVLGADRFFRDRGDERFGRRESGVEAAAVLDTVYLHIVRRRHEGPLNNPLVGRIGVSPRGSGSARMAVAILDAVGERPDVFDSINELLEQVAEAKLDAALVFSMPGDASLAEALADRQLTLHSLPTLSAELPVFLRPARIPRGTYVGQNQGVDTVGVQIVIAGPAPSTGSSPQAGGPAAALLAQRPPLTFKEANALARALQVAEPPDPALPAVWSRAAERDSSLDESTTGQNLLETGLNVLVTLFLGWIFMLVIRRPDA